MKKLFAVIFVLTAAAMLSAQIHNIVPKVAGDWKMSMDTPHGPMQGPLKVQQEGAKLTATYEVEHMGAMKLTGKLEGRKVSFVMEVPGGQLSLTGSVEGGKMSGTSDHGAWSATRE